MVAILYYLNNIITNCWYNIAGVAQSAVSGYGLDGRAIDARFPAEAKRFFL
jgi:hypothetical protein